MSQQQPGQGQADDGEILKVTIFGIITIMVIFAILATQEQRVNAVLGAVTWLHVLPFAMLVKYLPFLLDIPFLGSWFFLHVARAHDFLLEGGYAYMAPDQRSQVLAAGGKTALLYYGWILAWIALRGQSFRVDQKYRTRHNLESMIWTQSDIWMTSRIARHINPLKSKEINARRLAEAAAAKVAGFKAPASIALPSQHLALQPATWNRALRPEEWLISSGLNFDPADHAAMLASERSLRDADFINQKGWEDLKLETVSEVFAEQLRNPWLGPDKLRPIHKAAYAVMALFYAYDIEGGNRLLNDLGIIADAVKARSGAMDAAIRKETRLMSRIDAICTGMAGRQLALLAVNSAYVESAFPIMLGAARKDRGVLPPASFIWMKSEDRLMWYIMNNVGNEAICVEAAGALAHARAEQQIQRPIHRPAVYQASRALIEDYLDMTPERITARLDRETRRRSPGAQLDLIRKNIQEQDAEGEDA